MRKREEGDLPLARATELVVHEVKDEVLVYDLKRDRALCLNPTAFQVWKRCDGQTTAHEIAQRLEKDLEAPVDEDLVWFGLRQLQDFHLLQSNIQLPVNMVGITRRQMTSRLGVAAILALPVILSIASPTAAQAGSGATGVTGATGPAGPTGAT